MRKIAAKIKKGRAAALAAEEALDEVLDVTCADREIRKDAKKIFREYGNLCKQLGALVAIAGLEVARAKAKAMKAKRRSR